MAWRQAVVTLISVVCQQTAVGSVCVCVCVMSANTEYCVGKDTVHFVKNIIMNLRRNYKYYIRLQ